MKKVFSSHSSLAAAWVSGKYSEGRANNMFFEGDCIYSYGKHYVIARRLPNGVYLVSNRGYSSSTGKHTGHVRSALHYKYLSVHDADGVPARNREEAQQAIDKALATASRARLHGDFHRERAARIVSDTNAYLDAVDSTLPRLSMPD